MITIFEEYKNYPFKLNKSNSWIPIDDNLIISRSLVDKERGRIFFRFKIISDGNITFSKYTLLAGLSKIIGTKYENNQKVREIEIIRKEDVKGSTKISVMRKFLSGILEEPELGERLKIVSKYFYKDLDDIVASKDIGELIDRLKEFKKYFLVKQEDIYEEYLTRKDAGRYNL